MAKVGRCSHGRSRMFPGDTIISAKGKRGTRGFRPLVSRQFESKTRRRGDKRQRDPKCILRGRGGGKVAWGNAVGQRGKVSLPVLTGRGESGLKKETKGGRVLFREEGTENADYRKGSLNLWDN